MRSAALALALVVCPVAFAQTADAPHQVSIDGKPLAHASSVNGGYVTYGFQFMADGSVAPVPEQQEITLGVFPLGTQEFFDFLTEPFGSAPAKRYYHEVKSPRDPASGLATGRAMALDGAMFTELDIPSIDPSAKETPPPKVKIRDWIKASFDRVLFNPREYRSGWRNSDFSLTLDGVPIQTVGASSPMVIRAWEPHKLPGLDAPDVTIDDFSFDVPMRYSGPCLDAEAVFLKDPNPQTHQLVYTVMDGRRAVLTVSAPVHVTGVQDKGLFPFDGQPGQVHVTVSNKVKPVADTKPRQYVGHVTLIK